MEFDGKVVLGNREILKLPRRAEDAGDRGRAARWAWSSPPSSVPSAAKVTLLEMLPRIVPLEDEEISAELEKAFRKRGIEDLHRGAKWSR